MLADSNAYFNFFQTVAGAYLLTQKDVFLDRSHITQLLAYILAGKDVNIRIDLPPPVIVKVSQLFSWLASDDDDDDDENGDVLVVVFDDDGVDDDDDNDKDDDDR